jgi:hypothetical protein
MMKAIGYLLAGAALLSGVVAQLPPAADSTLPQGWHYKGCYAYVLYDRNLVHVLMKLQR